MEFLEKQKDPKYDLAILAGSDGLPLEILKNYSGRALILGLDGYVDEDAYHPENFIKVGLGQIGKILKTLKQYNIQKITFAGAVKRPGITDIKPDFQGALWLAKLAPSFLKGDDGLLTDVLKLVEREGLSYISPHELTETVLTPKGCLTDCQPTDQNLHDIQKGVGILESLSPHDIGQALIIENGYVLGIEAAEGTNELIQRCGAYKKGAEGILVKCFKNGQTDKTDLPTIGEDTILAIHRSGFKGIALSSGNSQIINRSRVIDLANAHSIFIIGL